MKYYFILLSFWFTFTCFAQTKNSIQGHPFSLTGKLIGRDTGLIVLWYPDTSGNWVRDTSYLNKGSFKFDGLVNEPSFAHLIGSKRDGNYADFFLEHGDQSITLKENSFDQLLMTGSKSQQLFDSLYAGINKIISQIENVEKEKTRLEAAIKDETDNNSKQLQQHELAELNITNNKLVDSITDLKIDFIKQHPHSYVSATVLSGLLIVTRYPVNKLKPMFEALDFNVRSSRAGLYCSKEIEKRSKLTAGNFIPDFQGINVNQQGITLSQFNNKYVLLDFWASWCVPCREAIPELKNVYTQYHSDGFEIIAISLDKYEDQWKKAIQIDGTNNWVHLLKNEEMESIFNPIQAIPQQILLDKEGKIIWSSLDDNNINWKDVLRSRLKTNSN